MGEEAEAPSPISPVPNAFMTRRAMTQRIKDPEGRRATSRRRSERLQMILTSPLNVFGGSEQARILHGPQAGYSHGDRGNFTWRLFPRRSIGPFLYIPGDAQGGGVWVSLSKDFPKGYYLRGGNSPMERSLDKEDLPIRVPSEEGKRRKVDRPQEPFPCGETSGDASMDGWIPGPIRSP
jgi:hypothetical protein